MSISHPIMYCVTFWLTLSTAALGSDKVLSVIPNDALGFAVIRRIDEFDKKVVAVAKVMNLPALRADDDDNGVYAAVFALGGSRWTGAAVERRPLNGTTWDYQLSIYTSGTLGRTVTALPNWSGPNVWDMNSQKPYK